MASGVLVILAGEATKLVPYLTAQDKRYDAIVALGAATDTLDAEGEITAEAPLPAWLAEELSAGPTADEGAAPPTRPSGGATPERAESFAAKFAVIAPGIEAALEAERGRREQVPPAHSAIQVGGRRSYERARAGEAVELPPRAVAVRSLRATGATASPPRLSISMEVAKGYYVRSLARDLGARLGVPAHLAALRRTASGALTLERAVPLDAGADALRAALIPLEDAARLGLPGAQLTEEGARRARLGQRLSAEDFAGPPPEQAAAWLGPDGRLVAIGAPVADTTNGWSVLRGFVGGVG